MSTQHATNSMSLPPPAIPFLSKLVFGAIAIAITVAVITIAPRTMTIPVAIVLAAARAYAASRFVAIEQHTRPATTTAYARPLLES